MRRRRAPDLLVLDTHVWVGLLLADPHLVSTRARAVLDKAADAGGLRVSAISVWEVAMLDVRGRVRLGKECLEWVREALEAPGVSLVPLTPDIAVASTRLPGSFHSDPADRIIVATARQLGAALVTKDAKILEYGRASHVSVLAA